MGSVEALWKMGYIDTGITFDVRKFNTSMSRAPMFGSVMSRFDRSNQTGIFRVTYQHQHFYLRTQETKVAVYPIPLKKAWRDRVLEHAANVLVVPSSTRGARLNLQEVEVTTCTNMDAGRVEDSPPRKHPRFEEIEEKFAEMSYWPDSPEASRLFQPSLSSSTASQVEGVQHNTTDTTRTEDYETSKEALLRRIELLITVQESVGEGWRNIMIGRDEGNYCRKTEIFEIRQRATFLCCAYRLALPNIMNKKTCQFCYQQACKVLNSLGLCQAATFYKTLLIGIQFSGNTRASLLIPTHTSTRTGGCPTAQLCRVHLTVGWECVMRT